MARKTNWWLFASLALVLQLAGHGLGQIFPVLEVDSAAKAGVNAGLAGLLTGLLEPRLQWKTKASKPEGHRV